MRTASSAFKEKVKSSSRNFINTAVITLTSQEVLTVTNANILFDGLEVEDSVGSDNTFDALGSTIINRCTLVLYNGDEAYSAYDFDDAKVVVSTGLVINNTTEPIQLGEFTVEEATYTTNSIVLSMLDNMSKFDRPYSESQLVYPATLADIVADACTTCGVTFNYAGSDFAYDTFSVATKPDVSSCTFRNVIGWVATINGTFARCNSLGQLEFKWFDLSGRPIPTDNITVVDENNVEHEHVSLVLSDGTLVDTISYLPGKNASLPEVKSLFSQDIAVTDITITGVTITVANIEDEADITSSIGTDDYRIVIADNPFITADNIEDVRDQIADKVLDLSFRKCSVKCVSNPLLEAGDTAYLVDTKGNEHRILLTRVTFSPTANQTIVCGADTPNRKSATLYSASTRTVAQMKSQVRALRDRMANVETIAGDTNQYFWFTETGTDTGAHITEVPQEDFTNPNSQSYHTGFNALFRSIGLAIRNGLTELATFSANNIRLGLANAKHILIDPDGISLYSAANTLLSSFTASGVSLYIQGVLRTALSNTGLIIYDTDGNTPVASFGETSQIGSNEVNHLLINSNGISGVNTKGMPVFGISMDIGPIVYEGVWDFWYKYHAGHISESSPNDNITVRDPWYPVLNNCDTFTDKYELVLTYSDETTASEWISGDFVNDKTIGSDDPTLITIEKSYANIVLKYWTDQSDGVLCHGFNALYIKDTSVTPYVTSVQIKGPLTEYVKITPVPAYSLGTRMDERTSEIGEFSGICGEFLSAKTRDQFACGRFNRDESDYAFMVGNGSIEDGESNAFAVTWDGNHLMALDEEATTGTDAELYAAITALGWEEDVII